MRRMSAQMRRMMLLDQRKRESRRILSKVCFFVFLKDIFPTDICFRGQANGRKGYE